MERTKLLLARWLESARSTSCVSVPAGIGLVLHGLGHAVFPLRGAGSRANSSAAKVLIELAWIVAMTSFVAGGFGLAGAHPLRRFWRACVAVGFATSVIAFASVRRLELMPGLVFDVLALAAFYRWANTPNGNTLAVPSTAWRRARAAVRTIVALSFTGYVAVCAFTRSWHSRWGVTESELVLGLPGDPPDRNVAFEVNHAVTIDAPPSAVWPWLVQIGQDRGGFYSYDVLENLFGLRIHNADRIHSEWQDRAVGDLVRATPPDWLGGRFGTSLGWTISLVEPQRALVLRNWGAFVLLPLENGRTRLFVRSKITGPQIPTWAAALSFATFEPIHFVMERRMLLGIKRRAERHGEPWPEAVPGAAVAGQ
jgi:hypothetical protein